MTENDPQHDSENESTPVDGATTADAIVTGGRQRRTIQKFGFSEPKDEEEEEFKPPVGPGVKLSEMEAVAERIAHMGKKDTETIKALYSIMYGRRFQQKNIRVIKQHMLEFSGIPDADDKTRQQIAGKIGRWMRPYLQEVMDLLGVDRSKKSFDEENKPHDKESLMNRLVEWFINPQESAAAKRKPAATKKKSPTAKKSAKTTKATKAVAGTKRKSTEKATKKPAKKAKTAAAADEADDATESEVEEEEEEDNADDSDFDEDAGSSKKSKSKRAPKKAAPRRRTKAAKDEEEQDEDDGANGDEEMPEAKPEVKDELGDEVRSKVKDIIANGDAEQLTVKKIVRQLSEDMGKDFSSQKAAIKEFVTNLAV